MITNGKSYISPVLSFYLDVNISFYYFITGYLQLPFKYLFYFLTFKILPALPPSWRNNIYINLNLVRLLL